MVLPTPQVHWTFDDAQTSGATLTDLGSLALDGTLLNTPLTGVDASHVCAGEAYKFDAGSTELVRHVGAATATTPMENGKFSIGIVAEPTAGGEMWCFGLGHDTAEGVWIRRDGSDEIGFGIEGFGTPASIATSTSGRYTTAQGPFAAVVVWDGTTMSLRVRSLDGEEFVSSTPIGGAIAFDVDRFLECAAHKRDTSDMYWFGLVADMRLWHSELTVAQQKEYLDIFCIIPSAGMGVADSPKQAVGYMVDSPPSSSLFPGVVDTPKQSAGYHLLDAPPIPGQVFPGAAKYDYRRQGPKSWSGS